MSQGKSRTMRQIIVTGGGTGIGRAVAAAFAEQGEQVVITGRRKDVLAETAAELGPTVRAVAFDAADPAQVAAALAELPDQVDVLVNNAGGNTDIGAEPTEGIPALDALAAAWLANLNANLLSAVLVTTALRKRLRPGGAVINLSSIAAHRGGSGSYGAAKAAVEAWTLTLAQQLGPEGITANVIAPGYIEDTEFFGAGISPERRAWNIAGALNQRAGTPADIAGTALYLASPAAGHLTGQTLHLNGGTFSGR
ncbi:SDR family NAD(P)-dependent oxidoreductase [Kitasatospora kifunensis]|uniref:3-oxoacyl-[acyl-carrier protein] reductase n=1 Tax=Kitasatospora kifunensis TaxID=58351 RepID=A0A7W7R5X4_KITKI|nr:SDR family oxidoreductase [Kitasatospora kifunensis]MBB4925944.1 3-oxoacyl-[acyl-carrier protein] reductase [Kitasatospora kifunensis]